jgi:hypothetical protein
VTTRAPGRGPVLTATMMASLPGVGRPETGLRLAGFVVTGRLGERRGPDGGELMVTVIEAPVPDGWAP